MGQSVTIEGHPALRPPSLVGAHDAWVLNAAQKGLGGGNPRFLVSVFAHDRPGLLRRATSILSHGVRREGGGRVVLNLEASLGVSLAELWALTLVVQPVAVEDRPAEELDRSIEGVDLKLELVSLLEEGLKSNGERAQVVVEQLSSSHSAALFSDRILREYRFASAQPDPSAWLGNTLCWVAEQVAQLGVPIPYFHFPHSWTLPNGDPSVSPPDGTPWLRIAFAPPPDKLGEQLQLDLAVVDFARRRNLYLAVYDPSRQVGQTDAESTDFSLKFIGIPTTSGSPEVVPPASTEPVLGLLIEGQARVGLVSNVLDIVGPKLVDASMSVLYGRSVLMLAVKAKASEQIVADLAENGAKFGFRVVHAPTAIGTEDLHPPTESFWVAWVCEERPGVVDAILDATTEAVEAERDGTANIVYAITRVLADGYSCAGKIKVSVTGTQVSSQEALRSRVEGAITQRLLPYLVPADIELGVRAPERLVKVSPKEPTEKPWATLAAYGASLGTW